MYKSVSIALASVIATASIVSADENYFPTTIAEQHEDGHIDLGVVRAAGDGIVEIYSYHLGEMGVLLGTANVHAGANPHVHVNIRHPATDVIALLRVGGVVVDTQEIEFSR